MILIGSYQSNSIAPIRIIFLAVCVSLFSTLTAEAQNWDVVQKIIGQQGEVENGILGFTFPRTDVQLNIYGTQVSPELAAKAWIGFWHLPDGQVQLMGDVAMPATNVRAAQKELLDQGLEITALHNHMLGEKPHMMFMHIRGIGQKAEALARKIKPVLQAAEVPLKAESEEEKEIEGEADWSAITKQLGKPEEQEGDVVEYTFRRADLLTVNGVKLPYTEALETKPEVAFQMMGDGEAATVGELFLRASEVNAVARILHKNDITITALHNHMLNTQPRMFWMHWWAKGDPGRLAKNIKAALKELNLQKEVHYLSK